MRDCKNEKIIEYKKKLGENFKKDESNSGKFPQVRNRIIEEGKKEKKRHENKRINLEF